MFSQYDFIRMNLEFESFFQKSISLNKITHQIIGIVTQKYKVISISNIMIDSKLVFNKFIQYIQINISKQLGSEVAKRYPSARSKLKAMDYSGK